VPNFFIESHYYGVFLPLFTCHYITVTQHLHVWMQSLDCCQVGAIYLTDIRCLLYKYLYSHLSSMLSL